MSRRVGQIVARGENRWLVRVYFGRDGETRQRKYYNRTIYGSLRQAQTHLTRKLHERDLCRGVEGVQVTLNEFLDHWLKTAAKSKVRENTHRDYEAMLRRYVRPHIGTKRLAVLSPLDIQGVYQRMSDRGLSSRTIRYLHAVLCCAFHQAVQWRLLIGVPTQGVLLPRHKNREMRVLTTEQSRAFLRFAMRTKYGPIFAIALTTGMRPSEYLALRWQDIDWERGTVGIVRSLHRTEGQWLFEDTKRTRSRRVIKLQNWVLDLLVQLRNATKEDATRSAHSYGMADLVFTTQSREPINERCLVKKHFKPILREAGLPDIGLYDLRHTAATLALTLGISPKVVSEQLGHASAAFTLDTYSHVLPHMQEEAAVKMELALVNGMSFSSAVPKNG